MIHVATVHRVDPKWIDPQLAALDRHIAQPFRVLANLEGVPDRNFDRRFAAVNRSGGTHAEKLNALAGRAVDEGRDTDLLMFIDGDALPVRALDGWISGMLAGRPLAAVRRAENRGDLQPHPCFCVTTVGFWRLIGGDWREGSWTNTAGDRVSDVGGRLLHQLRDGGHEWTDILRSNTFDLHPVLFGLYGRHVYHHGAGFRLPMTRSDERWWRRAGDYNAVWPDMSTVRPWRPADALTLVRVGKRRAVKRMWEPRLASMQRRSDEIHHQLCTDPEFYRRFEA